MPVFSWKKYSVSFVACAPKAIWRGLPTAIDGLPADREQRELIAQVYDRQLGGIGRTLPRPEGSILWRYPLLLESEAERDRLFQMLWRAGLGPSRLYRRPLGEMPLLKNRVRGASTPMAADFALRLLALPLHSSVHPADIDRMQAVLRRFADTAARTSRGRLAAGAA